MLCQATRERDVPLAIFADPGVVAPTDREPVHALVPIEHAGGRSLRQAKLIVRQLLAERDRVLIQEVAGNIRFKRDTAAVPEKDGSLQLWPLRVMAAARLRGSVE